jgi:hypothetical protein
MDNKGQYLEKYTAYKFGFNQHEKTNCKATEGYDLIDESTGITYQVKSDNATIANNFGLELGQDKVAELAELIQQDKSDQIILVMVYRKKISWYFFHKKNFLAMIAKNPDIAYYSYDSKTGKKTIRIKVKMKYDIIYQANAEKTLRD